MKSGRKRVPMDLSPRFTFQLTHAIGKYQLVAVFAAIMFFVSPFYLRRIQSFPETFIVTFALVTRFLVFGFGIFSHYLIGNHDLSNILSIEATNDADNRLGDSLVKYFLQMFAHWDSVHFLAIGRDGYVFEKQNAFFPFAPMLMRLSGTICIVFFLL